MFYWLMLNAFLYQYFTAHGALLEGKPHQYCPQSFISLKII